MSETHGRTLSTTEIAGTKVPYIKDGMENLLQERGLRHVFIETLDRPYLIWTHR